MTILSKLLGLKVSTITGEVTSLHSLSNPIPAVYEAPVSIFIGDYRLTIYNPFIFKGLNDHNLVYKITGLSLLEVFENNEEATFSFEDGILMIVDLRPESYSGPEAMTLTGPDDLIVVWN